MPFRTPRRLVCMLSLALAVLSASCASTSPTPAIPTPTTGAPATKAPAVASTPTVAPQMIPTAAQSVTASATVLQWFGQATFLLTTSGGTKLLMDPTNAASGYAILPMSGIDAVTVSHEHPDHNNVAVAQGSPSVIRGLKDNDWAKVSQTVKDIKIATVATYHDSKQGAERGKNTAFVLEVDGLRMVHLGDLGHQLSQEQIAAIGSVDVAMVPVGGGYTLDAAGATQMLAQLNPKIAIPMHFRTPKISAQSPLVAVDPFLQGKRVEKITTNRLETSVTKLPSAPTVYVLGFEP